MNITWLLLAYLLVLIFLAANRNKFPNSDALRPAWISFALIPISSFVFTLIKISNIRDPQDLALAEIWSNGIEWLFLGISMLFLTGILAPDNRRQSSDPGNSRTS